MKDSKWSRGLESNQLPSAYEAGERPVLLPGIEKPRLQQKNGSANRSCTDLHAITNGVRRYLRFGGM